MFDTMHVPGALLVTADGSIDCQENPNQQERTTSALHYDELVVALGVLAPGGSVFLKAFTLFEHSSFSLLYLCGIFFDEVRTYCARVHVACAILRACAHRTHICASLCAVLLNVCGVTLHACRTGLRSHWLRLVPQTQPGQLHGFALSSFSICSSFARNVFDWAYSYRCSAELLILDCAWSHSSCRAKSSPRSFSALCCTRLLEALVKDLFSTLARHKHHCVRSICHQGAALFRVPRSSGFRALI